jgi:hypothetical protein
MNEPTKGYGPLKAAAAVVLALMALAMGWGAYVSMAHWAGIGV